MDRAAAIVRFYRLLDLLEERCGGRRVLKECDGRAGWPRRGVYFFFEPGERRSATGAGDRVVRVGTHALTGGSRSTLWGRLSQHRGTARSGAGNHRGSIFRLLVGSAIKARAGTSGPRSWGVASGAGEAARKLGVDRATLRQSEAALERDVTRLIGAMPFLWLRVDDPPATAATSSATPSPCSATSARARWMLRRKRGSAGTRTASACGSRGCGTTITLMGFGDPSFATGLSD